MKRPVTNHSNRINHSQIPRPNAATAAYRRNKLIDYLLTGATTFGIVVAILFLITL